MHASGLRERRGRPAQVRLLREELASAQEAAAAAAGYAKQYEALAASSDEAFRAMQARRARVARRLGQGRVG
jgi:hypothetical protein